MTSEVKRKLEEAENNISQYIHEEECLQEMCEHCEAYCGKEHDYSNCKDMWCYKFYLAYAYLEWSSSY